MKKWLWLALLGSIGFLSLGSYVMLWATRKPGSQPGDNPYAFNRLEQTVSIYLWLFGGLFALYLVACFFVLKRGHTLPMRSALALIAFVAVSSRAVMVLAPPTLSDDMYRYIWDGRVQGAGLSPYSYPPGAPQVAPLHPQGYWIWKYINRKQNYTLYPPGAQLFFSAIYTVQPDSVPATKAAMSLLDLGSCAVLALLLASLGLPPTRTIVYAWSPLPIIEFGGSGHLAALEVLLTLLSLLAAVYAVRNRGVGLLRRISRAWTLAAAAVAAAILAMLIPALLLVAWLRKFGLKFAILCMGIFAAFSAGFLVWHGETRASTFMDVYLRDESFNAPIYYMLAKYPNPALGLSDSVIRFGLFVAFGTVTLIVMLKRERGVYDFIGKSFVLVAAYLFTATNLHPWYVTWLLLFVPLMLPPHGLPIFGHAAMPERVRWARGEYGPALAALAYSGLTFLGYTLFALNVRVVPQSVSIVQLGSTLCLGLLWPLGGSLYKWLQSRRASTTPLSLADPS